MRQLMMRRGDLHGWPGAPPLAPGQDLRIATAADAAALATLLASAFGTAWTTANSHRVLLDAEDVPRTFVVSDADVLVATASARLMPDSFPGSGYLHWVAVDPDHRGRRLGAVVSLAVLNYFDAIGCRDAVLETDAHRLAAITMYLALGFRLEAVEPEHVKVWNEVLQGIGQQADRTTESGREDG